jgi:hypothetical protein
VHKPGGNGARPGHEAWWKALSSRRDNAAFDKVNRTAPASIISSRRSGLASDLLKPVALPSSSIGFGNRRRDRPALDKPPGA